MNRSKALLLFIVAIFYSCDYAVRVRGIIYDSVTGESLENVEIRFKDKIYYSDNLGYYYVDYITGFKPELHFVFSKENYKPFEITIDDGSSSSEYNVKRETNFNELQRQWEDLNSTNFAIRNDSLFVFLTRR